jgi:hypothetical protein
MRIYRQAITFCRREASGALLSENLFPFPHLRRLYERTADLHFRHRKSPKDSLFRMDCQSIAIAKPDDTQPSHALPEI